MHLVQLDVSLISARAKRVLGTMGITSILLKTMTHQLSGQNNFLSFSEFFWRGVSFPRFLSF